MQLIDEQITAEKTRQVFEVEPDTFVKIHQRDTEAGVVLTGSLCGADGKALRLDNGEPWVLPHVQTVVFQGDHVTQAVMASALAFDRQHLASLVVASRDDPAAITAPLELSSLLIQSGPPVIDLPINLTTRT